MNVQEISDSQLLDVRAWHRRAEYAKVCDLITGGAVAEAPEAGLLWGLSLLMAGRGEEAAAILEQAMLTQPAHHAWRSDYALALLIAGRIDEAAQMIEAVVNDEGDAVDYGRLAAVRLAQRDADAGKAFYQEAILREPGRAEWHMNLASLQVRGQQLEEALTNYDRAVNLNPELAQAQAARQQLLVSLERTEELVDELHARHKEDESVLEHRLALARAYLLDERFTDAVQLLRAALTPIKALLPTDSEVEASETTAEVLQEQRLLRAALADMLNARARYGMALQLFYQLERLQEASDLDLDTSIIHCLLEMGRVEEAGERLQGLVDTDPDAFRVKSLRAHYCSETGDYQAAETILRELLEVQPGNAAFLTQLGHTLLWIGRLDEAADCFQQASAIQPMALANLVRTGKMPEEPAAVAHMEAFADSPLNAKEARSSMAFALAELHDKQGDHERAFRYLEQGNQFQREQLDYSPDMFSHRVDRLIAIFDEAFFAGLAPIRESDRTPVFVVGMPRSGTSLTEQILSSHSQVFGAGELDLLPVLTRLMPKAIGSAKPFPGCMQDMTPELREEAARYYLFGLLQYDEEAAYVVDKMPHNFMNVGLIASILPKARLCMCAGIRATWGCQTTSKTSRRDTAEWGMLSTLSIPLVNSMTITALWNTGVPYCLVVSSSSITRN